MPPVSALDDLQGARQLVGQAERALWDCTQGCGPIDAAAITAAVTGILRPLAHVVVILSLERVTSDPARRGHFDALALLMDDVLTDLERLRRTAAQQERHENDSAGAHDGPGGGG